MRLRRCLLDAAEAEAEREACAKDVVRFVSHWAWTYDPREEIKTRPLDPWPKQQEFLRWLGERESSREDGLVEKTRDAGATWLCAAYAAHGWLFRPGFSCGFGSRKLELVDQLGAPRSILEKVRILLDHLPGFLLPQGYRRDRHASYCRIVNPANGSVIVGEGGDNIGRGDRQSVYFVDEAAHVERPELVDQALSATTNVRIDVSTPRGVGNPFYRKRHGGKVPVFTFRWRDDPRKDDAWYQKQRETKDSVTLAQEVDLDYAASVEGIAIPAPWVRAAVGLRLRMSGRHQCGLDVGGDGEGAETALAARCGPVAFSLQAWKRLDTTQSAWKAAELGRKQECEGLYYDVCGIGLGVKSAWAASETPLGFSAIPVNGGDTPTNTRWPDGRTAQEIFANRRAEMWWGLRARFERTYERVTGQCEHPDEECVSIPDDPELIAQLSTPLSSFSSKGKVLIESKEDMKKRGVKSPDRADALALAFHPDRILARGSWGAKSY